MKKKNGDQFSDEEAERRLVSALRGARLTGHKPMADIPKKRTATIKKRALKTKRGA